MDMSYNIDLEMDKVVARITQEHALLVCLQLPEGLKPKALEIQQEIEAKTDATCVVWMGNAYGACDIPLHLDKLGVDLLVQFGHAEWRV